jgi:two-component system chemotaxis response regulator CheB
VAPIRILIVEDSMTQRFQLVSIIQATPDMVVVGQARDGVEAVQLTEKLRPDVISMDLRMPNLDGLEATRQIMHEFPTPIVIVSHATGDADLTMQAMQRGALAAIEKPPANTHPDYIKRRDELLSMLRLMAGVRVIRHWNTGMLNPERLKTGQLASLTSEIRANFLAMPEIIAIGSSAGGPSALATLFSGLPTNFSVPIVVVQHLTTEFMPGLASWLDRVSPLKIRLAEQGDLPVAGEILIAPGGCHLGFSADKRIVLDSTRGQHRHHPAVNAMMDSAAACYGSRAIGVILTGMGDDGATGLRAMRNVGARTIAQNEQSCAVFGMPAAAIALGAAEFVLPLEKIVPALSLLIDRGEGRNYATGSIAG